MWWTRIFSSVAGGRLPLAILFVLLALLGVSYGVGRSHANTAWEARWAAAEAKARDEAARVSAAHNARITAANGALKDAQIDIAARDDAIGRLAGRLRDLATPARVPAAPGGTQCVAELAAERDRAEALGQLLVRGSDLARALAAERDDAVARLWAASDAWPR